MKNRNDWLMEDKANEKTNKLAKSRIRLCSSKPLEKWVYDHVQKIDGHVLIISNASYLLSLEPLILLLRENHCPQHENLYKQL